MPPFIVYRLSFPPARATTATATYAAPACLSILAASLHVAPVVSTSSTSSTRACVVAFVVRARNAPRMFSKRRDGGMSACGGVLRWRINTRAGRERQANEPGSRPAGRDYWSPARAGDAKTWESARSCPPDVAAIAPRAARPGRGPWRRSARRARAVSCATPRREVRHGSRPARPPHQSGIAYQDNGGSLPPNRRHRKPRLRSASSRATSRAQPRETLRTQRPVTVVVFKLSIAVSALRWHQQISPGRRQAANAPPQVIHPLRHGGMITAPAAFFQSVRRNTLMRFV